MQAQPRLAAIIGAQRSGTTAIGRLIGAQPGMRYLGEVFHAARGPHDDPNYEEYLLDPDANFFSFKERFLTRFPALIYPSPRNQTAIWRAFRNHLFSLGDASIWLIDIKYNSFHHLNPVWQELYNWPKVLSLLLEESAPVVHLLREDLFAQCFSAMRADALKRWHVASGAPEGEENTIPIQVDPVELERIMMHVFHQRQHYSNLLRRYSPTLTLHYEQAFTDGDLSGEARGDLASLFGLDGGVVGPMGLRKLTTRPLVELVSNREAILAHFAGTLFQAAVTAHLGG